jgi:hypothetical protein
MEETIRIAREMISNPPEKYEMTDAVYGRDKGWGYPLTYYQNKSYKSSLSSLIYVELDDDFDVELIKEEIKDLLARHGISGEVY